MIHKIKHGSRTGYTQVPNAVLTDVNLSLKAKGLIAYMLSKPDDWQFYVKAMAAELKENKDTVARILTELIDAGYIVREEIRYKGQFKGFEYTVYHSPYPKKPEPVLPEPEKPEPDSSDNTNKDCTKKDLNKERQIAEAVIDYLNVKADKNYRYTATNRKLIGARLHEGFTQEDCERVIDHKVEQWKGDDNMDQYLRPSTLFAPTKFEGYLNQESERDRKDRELKELERLEERIRREEGIA